MMRQFLSTFLMTLMLYGVVHLSIFASFIKDVSKIDHKVEGSPHRIQTTISSKNNPKEWKTIVHGSNDGKLHNALILSVAPRTVKHVVALWTELECFTSDVDYVLLSGPTWSEDILHTVSALAKASIPIFSSGRASLNVHTSVNDRYDVGLWCDGLDWMEQTGQLANYEQFELLNDSIFALGEYSSVLSALQDHNASMTSLCYSLIRPEGTGPDMFWVESVWRGFDRRGIQTFRDYSCRPANDPLFCSRRWWGKKGCIVENFERNMVRQFPREKVVGLFASDVPSDMLTRKQSFPTWVRHPPYWEKLVEEQNFPVSKVNWPDMIGSIDDDRLMTCTRFLDRSTLDRLDFSIAIQSI